VAVDTSDNVYATAANGAPFVVKLNPGGSVPVSVDGKQCRRAFHIICDWVRSSSQQKNVFQGGQTMKSLNLKLFTVAMAAVLPAIANALTSVSDSTGVHVNFATPWFQGYNVVQLTTTPNGSTLTGNDGNANDSRACALATLRCAARRE
jgi:hypothetical protein